MVGRFGFGNCVVYFSETDGFSSDSGCVTEEVKLRLNILIVCGCQEIIYPDCFWFHSWGKDVLCFW